MKDYEKELLKGAAVIGGYLIIPSFLFTPLNPLIKSGMLTTLSANIVILAVLAVMFSVLYFEDLKNNFKDFKKNYKSILKISFKYWLIGIAGMIVSSLVIELIGLESNSNQEANVALLKEAPILEFILAVILAPIVEELVFRRGLRKAFNNKHLYAIITGIIFAFIHVLSSLSKGPQMYIYLIPYASVGIAFGYSYFKTKNIYGTIVTHAFHNLISLLIIIFM